jgi:hypothetical protein
MSMVPFNDTGAVSGLLCGVLFGAVLESAGFGSPCKLTAQFRLTDWSVFKVMFTAIVVAATGLWLLRMGGVIAADALFVPGSYVVAAAVGGALVGAGFAVGGYCPGTSVVGFFSGRMDAMVFLLGLLAGTAVFAALYGPALEHLLSMGEVSGGDTLSEAFGIPEAVLIVVLFGALGAVFLLGGRMERARRGPVSAEEAVAGADESLTA